jgi:hypothetical protein
MTTFFWLLDLFGQNQSGNRLLLKHAVAVMVSRLGPCFPSAFMCGSLSSIVQTVVVEHKIAGIESVEL